MRSELPKVCPCGQVPPNFSIDNSCYEVPSKYLIAYPNCCCEWHFEFRSNYSKDMDEIQKQALDEWNRLPRYFVE